VCEEMEPSHELIPAVCSGAAAILAPAIADREDPTADAELGNNDELYPPPSTTLHHSPHDSIQLRQMEMGRVVSPGGVTGLLTWTIPAVISCCFLPYALRGLSLPVCVR
jgi:hypothetical protein